MSTNQTLPWEVINLKVTTSTQYPNLNMAKINKEHTINLRRGFNDMVKVVLNFMDKETRYLEFLDKRASIHPRCLFAKHHEREIGHDLKNLADLKQRLLLLRDNVFVVGDQNTLEDVLVVDCFMPVSEDAVNSSELGMALYNIDKV